MLDNENQKAETKLSSHSEICYSNKFRHKIFYVPSLAHNAQKTRNACR